MNRFGAWPRHAAILIVALALALMPAGGRAADAVTAEDAGAFISKLGSKAITELGDESVSYDTRVQTFRQMVQEYFAMEAISRFAVEKDLLVISDEIYSELTYEGGHTSIASLPGMRDRTIFLHGFSKAYAMTGFRIGYACGPAPLIEAMMKVHQYSMLCAPILSQEAASEALRNGRPAMEKMRDQYRDRRDFLVARFREAGLPCHLPKGTFYAFADVRETGLDERTFAKRLLEEEEVAVVPGTAFGPAGKGFIRASFSTSFRRLREAADRIDRFVGNQQ